MLRAMPSFVCTAFLLALSLCAGEAARANHYILPCSGTCINGRWIFTGDLNVGRSQHTATLLQDGRVLVVGGRGTPGALDSAELYDPATGRWTVTGRMSMPRVMHTATLLADGKVLVAGGISDAGPPDFGVTATAELYDPVTGTWSPTGSMRAARFWYAATRLQDGRVLVAGGADPENVGTAELYDARSGTWSPAGKLQIARYGHAMTTLADGSALIVGGSNDGDLTSTLGAAAELFDPASGNWRTVGNITWGGVMNTATLLATGQVLVAGGNGGGIGGDVVFAATALFNPASGSWIPAGNLAARRYSHTATRLLNGSVLIAGGTDQLSRYPVQYLTLGSTELFEPQKGAWSRTPDLNVPRSEHTSTLLADGTVLVVGGTGANASCELYVRGLDAFANEGQERGRKHVLEPSP
jgi:N-acetylneuraminic acid mutarotase